MSTPRLTLPFHNIPRGTPLVGALNTLGVFNAPDVFNASRNHHPMQTPTYCDPDYHQNIMVCSVAICATFPPNFRKFNQLEMVSTFIYKSSLER